MLRRIVSASLFAMAAATGTAVAQAAPITVYVVRHAEKGPEIPDPSLTESGKRRAAELARILADSGVTALYVTEFKRTQETLAPLAAKTNVAPVQLLARDINGLVAALRALPPGSHAVVATHSNLVHLIVERLVGVKIRPLTDMDYDRLVVVTVTGKEKGKAVVERYGAH